MCSPDLFLGLIALIFPPLPVWVKTGICSADSLINICLCMLGVVPGVIHSWYIIAKFPEGDQYESLPQDAEGGRVTYVVITAPDGRQTRTKAAAVKPTRPAQSAYGTTAPMAPPVHQNEDGTWSNGGEGGSTGGVPPTYAEAVKGDNKIQSNH